MAPPREEITPETPDILCLDDDPVSLARVKDLLELNEFTVHTAKTMGQALEIALDKPIAIILAEIDIPGFNTNKLNKAFYSQGLEPAIIIYSRQPEPPTSKLRELGKIFHYATKDVTDAELVGHVKKALTFYWAKKKQIDYFQKSRDMSVRQFEWLLWHEKQHTIRKTHFGIDLISSIKHSINQGMGVGALVTQLELLEMQMQRPNRNQEKIDKLLGKIIGAGRQVNTWLEQLENLSAAFSKKHFAEEISCAELPDIVTGTVKWLDAFQQIKNQKVIVNIPETRGELYFSRDLLGEALRELLTNAYKYSPDKSKVHVTLARKRNFCAIIILNDIIPGSRGIPESIENLVFEPFYRVSHIYDERFLYEELGLGIGLTVIRNNVNHLGGQVFLYEVMDHTSGSPRKRVVAELILPLRSDESDFSVDRDDGNDPGQAIDYVFRTD